MLRRALTVLALVLFGAYQAMCFTDTWRDTEHQTRLFPLNLTWPASWRMFTLLDTWNSSLDFQGWDGETWVHLPMERWYPTRWDSGYRWERSAPDGYSLDRFLALACTRSGLDRTRAVEVRWMRTPGEEWQPEKKRSEQEKRVRDCSRAAPTVSGRKI